MGVDGINPVRDECSCQNLFSLSRRRTYGSSVYGQFASAQALLETTRIPVYEVEFCGALSSCTSPQQPRRRKGTCRSLRKVRPGDPYESRESVTSAGSLAPPLVTILLYFGRFSQRGCWTLCLNGSPDTIARTAYVLASGTVKL